MSDSLRPHGPQHARPPCPSPTPRAYPNSCPLSRWYDSTISSSVILFSSCLQSFPAPGSFQMSQINNLGIEFCVESDFPLDYWRHYSSVFWLLRMWFKNSMAFFYTWSFESHSVCLWAVSGSVYPLCQEIPQGWVSSFTVPPGFWEILLSIYFRFIYLSWLCPVACGILVPWPEIKPGILAVKPSSNHWTSGEALSEYFFAIFLLSSPSAYSLFGNPTVGR